MGDLETAIAIRRIAADDPALGELIRLTDEYMSALYPAESNHLEPPAALAAPNVSIFGAYAGEQLIGCVAAKIMNDDGRYAEIKRLYVLNEYRGAGVARRLMDRVEDHVRSIGVAIARLETGVKQPEALRFYEIRGYVHRPPFASYRPDPLSVFMEKRLA